MSATSNATGRVFGVLALMLQIGMLFAYGFEGSLLNEGILGTTPTSTPVTVASQFLIEYVLMAAFALLGFGLLLSFLKYGTWSGMATALLVISVNIQLGLLFQKFWFNIFTNGFGNQQDIANAILLNNNPVVTTNNAFAEFFDQHQFVNIQPNVTILRITLMNTISCLVAFLGFIGRIGLLETFLTTVSFNVGWNLAYYLNFNLHWARSPSPIAFDDMGTDTVYLFGSFFALFMMIILACKPAVREENKAYVMNRISGLLGLLGTAFVFATFALTGHNYPVRFNNLSNNLQSMNVIYALASSVVCSYIFSALFNKGSVGIREAMLGTITGGVLVGCVSAFPYNLTIALAIGAISGLITAFWLSFIHPKINSTRIFDSHGILGTFWIASIFGGVIFAPSLIQVYVNYGFGSQYYGVDLFVDTAYNFAQEAAGFQLVYAGIAAGVGAAFGLGTGIVMVCLRNTDDDFNDAALFVRGDYGLYNHDKVETGDKQESAAHLKNENQ